MDTLERLNNEYPCDKRGGYKGNGCGSCKKNKKKEEEPVKGGKIICNLHNYPVPPYECEECPYQERTGKSRALNNK